MRRFPLPYWCVVVAGAVIIAAAVTWHFSMPSSAPTRVGTPTSTAESAAAPQPQGDGAAALQAGALSAQTHTTSTEITAHAYIVVPLAHGGTPLATKNATARWPLASLTKLMTARIVLEKMAPDQPVTTVAVPGNYVPSAKYLPPGETYRVADLLHVMLVESSNEAAESFAAAYGRDAFITEMNNQAAAWGLSSTHFDDPAGLSVASQSTAHDILALVQHLYAEDPQLFQITQLKSFVAPSLNGTSSYTAVTTNEFAGRPTFIGGKTGYTDEAQGNLISLFSVRGTPFAIIVLGSADRFGETRTLLKQYAHATP